MLVLCRNPEQSIKIGDHIEVKVLEVRGRNVRLGITAPPEVSVHRSEIYEAIQKKRSRTK